MKATVIFVGIGQWEEYTKPLLHSLFKHQWDSFIIGVDNGDKYSLAERIRFSNVWTVPNFDNVVSYASAMNAGLSAAKFRNSDWTIIINNDVLCTGEFISELEKLDTNTLYSNKLHTNFKKFKHPTPFVDGWLYAIPRKILNTVGKFDENFKIAGFEDADYCIRAWEKGFRVKQSNLPFVHLEEHIRTSFDNYKKHRLDNMTYLIEKHGLVRR